MVLYVPVSISVYTCIILIYFNYIKKSFLLDLHKDFFNRIVKLIITFIFTIAM